MVGFWLSFHKNHCNFGVRGSSWALECVEFRVESISDTFRAIPRDLGVHNYYLENIITNAQDI